MSRVSSPAAIAAALAEFWSPEIIAEVDDAYVKVAKVKGSLTWHHHEHEDEFFMVLKGRLRIEMKDEVVDLETGDCFVVPKGVRHNPRAEEECHLLLIEKKSTQHTGEVVMSKTKSVEDQLRGRRNSR